MLIVSIGSSFLLFLGVIRFLPRTRLIEKPYSLVLLVETLEEMLAESSAGSPNLH